MRAWKVTVRHPQDGYTPDDGVSSGRSYPRYVDQYVVASSKNSAMSQARQMVGWPALEGSKHIRAAKVIGYLSCIG